MKNMQNKFLMDESRRIQAVMEALKAAGMAEATQEDVVRFSERLFEMGHSVVKIVKKRGAKSEKYNHPGCSDEPTELGDIEPCRRIYYQIGPATIEILKRYHDETKSE